MGTVIVSILQMRKESTETLRLLVQGSQLKCVRARTQAWLAKRFTSLPLPTPSLLENVVRFNWELVRGRSQPRPTKPEPAS